MADQPQLPDRLDPDWDDRVSTELPKDSPLYSVSKDILAEVPLETLAIWHENTQLQSTFPICGFPHRDRTREKRVIICANRAGLNTKHLDEGRCYIHEFPEQLQRTSYARQLVGFSSLQEIYEEIATRQKGIKDLSEEITMARSILASQLSELRTGKSGKNSEVFSMVLKAIEQIRKTADTIASIEEKEARGLTMESISGFLWHLHRILNEELLEPKHKARIFDRIAEECIFVQAKQ